MTNAFVRGLKRLFGVKPKTKPCCEDVETSKPQVDLEDKSLATVSEPASKKVAKKKSAPKSKKPTKKKVASKKKTVKKTAKKKVSKKKTN